MIRCIAYISLLVGLPGQSVAAQNQSATEFFESQVRPLLTEHCTECHGADTQEAGLRLDSRAGFLRGSDSGAVFFADQPDQSLILRAVRYNDDVRMPPDGRLPETQIAAIEQWIRTGAFWPNDAVPEAASVQSFTSENAKFHWAFQPIRAVMDSQSVDPRESPQQGAGAIDKFVVDRLNDAGLTLSVAADRRTLVRRAFFDLHGLPPSPAEVQEFEQDTAADAWPRLIDRLLASSRYGERWARHWLDVARYADTKGYVRLNDNPLYPAAWTYRDYVIRAFNEDLPFDQFVKEQIAADVLLSKSHVAPNASASRDSRSLAAMGFLTLGQRFINSQNDIIDDRIDVVTRGLLGLTVTCARCHDHKFDPIPTADYYSLHGVFASSVEPDVPPLILPAEELPRYEAYHLELQRRTKVFREFLETKQQELEALFRKRAGEYLLAAQFEKVQANFLPVMFLIDSTKDLNPAVIQRWARMLERTRREHHSVLEAWHQLAHLSSSVPAEEFPAKAAQLVALWRSSESDENINRAVGEKLSSAPLTNLTEVSECYGQLFQEVDQEWNQARLSGAAALADPDREGIRQLLHGPGAPSTVALQDVPEFLFVDATTQNQFHEQQRQIEDLIASPGAAPHAHILLDANVPVEPHIFLRGNASNPGDAVPRQFLKVLSSSKRAPFRHGSGRLELAQAIVDPKNPLTARVLVNRVWLHHFGAGLVRTPSDFGLRGEPPSHPELLDDLAARFIVGGWSIKSLHRMIMLSSAYQQRSDGSPAGESIDPENKLWWRMNRRRLDWESLRDSILAVSGRLDLTMGGPSQPILTEPFSGRRSVYGFIDRQNLPGLLRTFDVVAPDSSAPQRLHTCVPQQPLFMMNSEFLKEHAVALATRISPSSEPIPPAEVIQYTDALHWLLFGRPASAEDIDLGLEYLSGSGSVPRETTEGSAAPFTRWQEYVHALLMSNEFMFVD